MSPADSSERQLNACPACGQHVDVTELEPFSKIPCPNCDAAMRVRVAFDHFLLLEQIGMGGMSRVFRASDTSLNRDVALKILNQECGNDAERTAQFEREARTTASISHPNVVKVFSVGKDQGYFYIAMELVSYSSFDDVITRRGRVSEGEVLNIGIAVTQGLLAARHAGLIHRDIKPGNILFAEDGTAKIVDFGLALVVERDVDTSTEIWATPYYVAPEKLHGRVEDFRSDLYSLGATLFHALAGVPPVEVSTTSIEELRKLKARPVDLAAAAPDISCPTVAVINRMLAHEPDERFSSYESLMDALQAAKLGKTMPEAGEIRGRYFGRRKKILIAAIAAVLAVGAVAIGLRWSDPASSDADAPAIVLDDTVSSADSATRDFLLARKQLLDGDHASAAALFSAVAERGTTRQPTTNWAFFNLGLCRLLLFEEEPAMAAFRKIVDHGVYSEQREDLDQVSFFLDAAKLAQSRKPARPEQLKVFADGGYRPVILLAIGLRRWGLGDFVGAAELLQEFSDTARSSREKWVSAYQTLALPFLTDAALLRSLPVRAEAGSPEEKQILQAFVPAATEAMDRLQIDGPHRDDLAARLERARRRIVALENAGAKESALAASNRLKRDRPILRRELDGLASFRDQLDFETCVAKLNGLKLESERGMEERDAWVWIYNDTNTLLKGLGQAHLEKGFSGPVIRRGGAPLWGKSYRAIAGGITIVNETGSETTVPFSECAPTFLLSLGEQDLRSTMDTDQYLRKLAGIVSLARLYGLQSAVGDHIELLASAVERDKFGSARLGILAGDAPDPP